MLSLAYQKIIWSTKSVHEHLYHRRTIIECRTYHDTRPLLASCTALLDPKESSPGLEAPHNRFDECFVLGETSLRAKSLKTLPPQAKLQNSINIEKEVPIIIGFILINTSPIWLHQNKKWHTTLLNNQWLVSRNLSNKHSKNPLSTNPQIENYRIVVFCKFNQLNQDNK